MNRKEKYVKAIDQYLLDEHAEEVTDANPETDSECYFLPHHGVFREMHESTKLRIVFNASAKDHLGWSLNDSLLCGKALQPDLAEILIKFRSTEYVLMGDIQKMFLQVKIRPSDRKYLRFLWRSPGSEGPVKVYQKTVLPFGLNCSPYIAIRTIQVHLDRYKMQHPELVKLFKAQCYVDDVVLGASSEEELFRMYEIITRILAEGHFKLTKFLTNSKQVLQKIPVSERSTAAQWVIAEKDLQ